MARALALLVLFATAPAAAQGAEGAAKVAVVVAGDPDASLRDAARRLDAHLDTDAELLPPGDPGVRQALRGEPPPAAEDGLERLRAERRRLGWNERDDAEVLDRLGHMTGAHLLLVVRRAPEVVVEAYDVSARSFYEDRLALASASETEIAAFVGPRARAARRRAAEPSPPRPAEAAASAPPGATRDAPAAAPPLSAPAPEVPPARRWMKKNWPYLVAGVLLAGVITGVVVSRRNDDTPPPVLRFVPGGNE